MGTRAITTVTTADGKKLLNLYRQNDGYPSGHGKQLFDFLDGMQIINGISGERAGDAANGAGCLAAQMVARFKSKIGLFYLYPVDQADCGQDYAYHITVTEKRWDSDATPGVTIKVVRFDGEVCFEGSVEDFGKFVDTDEEEEE